MLHTLFASKKCHQHWLVWDPIQVRPLYNSNQVGHIHCLPKEEHAWGVMIVPLLRKNGCERKIEDTEVTFTSGLTFCWWRIRRPSPTRIGRWADMLYAMFCSFVGTTLPVRTNHNRNSQWFKHKKDLIINLLITKVHTRFFGNKVGFSELCRRVITY